jgi:DNA-binding MarR family transcriptional regulator
MKNSVSIEVYWVLKYAYNHIKKQLRDKLTENDITWPQYHALYHIGDKGTPSNELAKELNCNASNMTGLIDRMIESGWVYREHSSEDRRIWLVKLTDEGKNLRTKLIPIHLKNIEDRMNVLSDQELSTLKSLLEKLANSESEEMTK